MEGARLPAGIGVGLLRDICEAAEGRPSAVSRISVTVSQGYPSQRLPEAVASLRRLAARAETEK